MSSDFDRNENYLKIMNFTKLCLLFINPVTISILLFVPLTSLDTYGQEESVIPESNVTDGGASGGGNLGGESVIPESDTTGGDSSGGGNLDGESIIPESDTTVGDGSGGGNLGGESIIPESDITQGILVAEDGTITATPEIIARLDQVAISLIDDLNAGTVEVINADGEVVSVHVDTQQIIADILEQDSTAGEFVSTDISLDNGTTLVDVTPADFVDAVFNAVGEDVILVNTDDFDITITLVGADNSLNLKTYKVADSNQKRQTLSVKTVNKLTGKTKTRIITGTPQQVKSAASVISALTIAGAADETIDVAEAIASDSSVEPGLLIDMMLNYEGLIERDGKRPVAHSKTTRLAMNTDIKGLLTAENQKSVVDLVKFASSIRAYNQLVQQSEPEVYQELSQTSEFQLIGKTLDRLRQSI